MLTAQEGASLTHVQESVTMEYSGPIEETQDFGLTDSEYVRLTEIALKHCTEHGYSREELIRNVDELAETVEMADLIRWAIKHPELFEDAVEEVSNG